MNKLFTFVITAGAILACAVPVEAASLEWKDISNVLPVRKNRPVWDVEYAAPYVYFTDGIAFSKGGFVARTDGKWTKNLSKEIVQLGVKRVDEIKVNNSNLVFQQFYPNNTVEQQYAYPHEWPTTLNSQKVAKLQITNEGCLATFGQTSVFVPYINTIKDCNPHMVLSAWNGADWYVLVAHKTLLRLDGNSLTLLGRVRDYFTSMTSDGRGVMYFGGAWSRIEKNEPTLPLTAKLMKVTDPIVASVMVAQPSPTVPNTNSGKTATWTWTAPTVTSLAQDGWTTFNVGAWHAQGISKIELYQQGVLIKTCDGNAQTVNCGVDVSAKNHAVGSNFELKGKVTDKTGAATWTDATSIKVTAATGVVQLDQKVEIAVSNDFVPSIERLGRNGSTVFRVTARAKAGLKRIVVHANGSQRSMCVFSGSMNVETCDYQVNGWDFPYNQVTQLTAQAVDSNDRDAWAGVRTVLISDDVVVLPSNGTIWLSKNGNILTAGSNDPDGTSSIDVYVNGVVRQSCGYPAGYGSRECSVTVTAADLTNGTYKAKAKVKDAFGNVAWSEEKSFGL